MGKYRHVLAATSGSERSEAVASRAKEIAASQGARLSLVQVLDYSGHNLPSHEVVPEGEDKDEWLDRRAFKALRALSERLQLSGAELAILHGSPKQQITEYARSHGVDLIVLGAYERHGLDLLFASTTDGVVHRAPCDVLAVHVEH